jgi:glycosyltransferase involved in cell wall biosynthesis
MRITFLLEVADQLWGGVKVALEDANWLSQRGHQVTIVSRSGPPAWMQLDCGFCQVPDFRPENLPDGDVLIGTFWSTVPWVASAGPGKGAPVHLCQGYEGDNPENQGVRDRIEATYRLPGMHHVTISPHLTALLKERFGVDAHEVRYVIDHQVHKPGPFRPPQSPLRVGLVGPYSIPWKDLPTGYAACELAARAGQNLVLVRASNTPPSPEERDLPFAVEWHQELRPDQMGDFYRSLDVFLGTSSGAEEGFFLPAIEAMACGVPSVLTDIPCFRNHGKLVGHDRYALFVEPKDPRAMAEAIVLAGALPDVRTALRAGGIEVAGHYRPEYHGEQLEAVLQQLADAQPPQAAPASAAPAAPAAPQKQTILPTPAPAPANAASDDHARRSELRLVTKEIPTPSAGAAQDQHLRRLFDELRQTATRHRSQGNHVDAARAFAAARCLDDADPQLLFDLCGSWLASNQPQAALATLDQQLAGADEQPQLHVLRGNALHMLGRLDEAALAIRAAITAGQRNADTYNLLGVVLFQNGDVRAARESFERALVLDPQHGDARANLNSLPAA